MGQSRAAQVKKAANDLHSLHSSLGLSLSSDSSSDDQDLPGLPNAKRKKLNNGRHVRSVSPIVNSLLNGGDGTVPSFASLSSASASFTGLSAASTHPLHNLKSAFGPNKNLQSSAHGRVPVQVLGNSSGAAVEGHASRITLVGKDDATKQVNIAQNGSLATESHVQYPTDSTPPVRYTTSTQVSPNNYNSTNTPPVKNFPSQTPPVKIVGIGGKTRVAAPSGEGQRNKPPPPVTPDHITSDLSVAGTGLRTFVPQEGTDSSSSSSGGSDSSSDSSSSSDSASSDSDEDSNLTIGQKIARSAEKKKDKDHLKITDAGDDQSGNNKLATTTGEDNNKIEGWCNICGNFYRTPADGCKTLDSYVPRLPHVTFRVALHVSTTFYI